MPETEPENAEMKSISVSDLSKFVIIRSDEDYLFEASAKTLHDAIQSSFSLDLDFKTDFVTDAIPGYGEAEFEILVGPCDREESGIFASDLKYNDYGYAIVGNKLVIAGVTAAETYKAVGHFIEQVVNNRKGEVFFDNAAQSYLFRGEYTDLSINGTPISEYSIVYPSTKKNSEDEIAKLLRTFISEISGYTLEVKTDTAEPTGKEIRIGVTSRDSAPTLAEGQCFVGNSGESVLLCAADTVGLINAFNSFVSMIEKTPSLTVKDTASAPETGDELVVLDYNVWMHTAGQEGRVQALLNYIEKLNPDLMGLQECTHEWMAFITEKFSAEYGIIGEGRDGTHTSEDQFNPILYRKDKFTLIDSGTRWLSETPEVKYTKVPDSTYERIFTFAVLEEKATGKQFVFISTHFDHEGGQADQASAMIAYISQFRNMPMLMCGDYNGSGVEKIMIEHGYLSMETAAAEKVNPGNTYSGGNKIDFIFTNGKGITATYYEVDNDNGNSDHYPLIAKFKFIK
jgi:endonuclease/exonuclease/phosphatase family metal-dependent hydrolase